MPVFLLAFFLMTLPLAAAEPDFYVWQRLHTPEVRNAAEQYYRESSGRLFFLAGELENSGKTVKVSPPDFYRPSRSVPVIRIHVRNISVPAAVLAEQVISLFHPWRETKSLQIDLDAPESKLSCYRDLMLELRKRLPGTELSATVLPCHLKHEKDFRELAEVCDFYVLQVHGLEKTGSGWKLFDPAAAERAVKTAKKWKHPFRTALPLYCGRVGKGICVKPDLSAVSRLAAGSPGVIGFRLGVKDDPDALDLKTSLEICRGKGYSPSIELKWEGKPGDFWRLSVRNHGFFPERKVLRFRLSPEVKIEDFDTFYDAGFLPAEGKLTLTLPPAGSELRCLWLRCGNADLSAGPPLSVRVEDP